MTRKLLTVAALLALLPASYGVNTALAATEAAAGPAAPADHREILAELHKQSDQLADLRAQVAKANRALAAIRAGG